MQGQVCAWGNKVRLFGIVIILSFLGGCTGFQKKSDTPSSRDELRLANHSQALVTLGAELDEEGKDRFLYLAGAGLIKNLHGDYEDSNRNLEEAVRLSEELQTKRVGNLLKIALSSPSSGDYGGTAYERAYLHYYKALNYIMLAANSTGDLREENLEGARIEARRVDILLTEIQNIEGSYQETKEKKGSIFKTLLKILRGFQGRTLDSDWLVYREDAYVRYMEGIIYESNGEYDDARIAYQNAAKLYEQGYAKQYGLGEDIIELAWFDTVRMMQWAGGYGDEWPVLAEEKLSEKARQRLKFFEKGTAQLIVVTHAGFVPERKEMSMYLRLDKANKELVVRPSVVSLDIASSLSAVDYSTKDEQLAWFSEMYSGSSLLAVIGRFNRRSFYGGFDELFERRTSIAPLWSLVESVGLLSGMSGMGTTVKVPYYGSIAPDFGDTEVWLDNENKGVLVKAESLANIALQEQLLNASNELRLALARELTKVIICANAGRQLEGFSAKLAEKVCIVTWGAFARAETRNWLTLPHTVQIQRFPVKEGVHKVKLVTKNALNQGVYYQNEQHIEIKKGAIYLLRNRAISRPNTPQHVAGR